MDGLPVRAGLLEENVTTADIDVIREYVDGLTLPIMAGPGGRCSICGNGTGGKASPFDAASLLQSIDLKYAALAATACALTRDVVHMCNDT